MLGDFNIDHLLLSATGRRPPAQCELGSRSNDGRVAQPNRRRTMRCPSAGIGPQRGSGTEAGCCQQQWGGTGEGNVKEVGWRGGRKRS